MAKPRVRVDESSEVGITLKEQALARVAPAPAAARRYRPPDKLLGFLENL